jgi:hypothetical protein
MGVDALMASGEKEKLLNLAPMRRDRLPWLVAFRTCAGFDREFS